MLAVILIIAGAILGVVELFRLPARLWRRARNRAHQAAISPFILYWLVYCVSILSVLAVIWVVV